MIKLREWREARLKFNKDFASIVFLSLELITLTLYMISKLSGKNDLVRWIRFLISERVDHFKNRSSEIDEKTIFGMNRYNGLERITVGPNWAETL
jgi:hypothetical protein